MEGYFRRLQLQRCSESCQTCKCFKELKLRNTYFANAVTSTILDERPSNVDVLIYCCSKHDADMK